MKEQPRLSRRSALATVAGGAVLGAVWGALFPIVASASRPSLAIVGHRLGQVVLADSGEARALIFLGEPDDVLIERIPSIMTLFRQRIDVVVGSKPVLEERAFPLEARWAVQHAVMISKSVATPTLAMPATIVSEQASIDLGRGMSLECSVAHRGEWLAGHEQRPALWIARLVHPSGDVALLPDEPSLEAHGPLEATLVVMPAAAPATLGALSNAGALAINHDSGMAEEDASPTFALTRIYPQDVARFAFGDGGIELPVWTDTGQPQRPVTGSRSARR